MLNWQQKLLSARMSAAVSVQQALVEEWATFARKLHQRYWLKYDDMPNEHALEAQIAENMDDETGVLMKQLLTPETLPDLDAANERLKIECMHFQTMLFTALKVKDLGDKASMALKYAMLECLHNQALEVAVWHVLTTFAVSDSFEYTVDDFVKQHFARTLALATRMEGF